MAQEFLPDAILLDVMMPGLDGFETCRQIRQKPLLAEIPIVMLTALDDSETRLDGLRSGADDFLNKSFDRLELQIRIKNILRINRYRNLIAERSRFYWAVENAEKGYLILDEQSQIQYANQQAQLYFYLQADYAGLDFYQQAGRYYQIRASVRWESQLSKPVERKVSYLVQPETLISRAFWLRVEELITPLEIENQRLLAISDITNEMSTQQNIRKISLLVAHKLRTPFSIIQSALSFLNEKIDSVPFESAKMLIKNAWRSSEQVVANVQQILNYIEAPLSLSQGEPLRVHNLEPMIRVAGELFDLKEIVVTIPRPCAKQSLNISTSAMELIIHELLQNSKKFHPEQAPQVQIRVEAHGENALQIRFMDDGRYMTAEQIIWASQPYTQSEKWFTGETPGMGLGMTTVTTLVWQAGGQVRISNRDDLNGISVSLTLPVMG